MQNAEFYATTPPLPASVKQLIFGKNANTMAACGLTFRFAYTQNSPAMQTVMFFTLSRYFSVPIIEREKPDLSKELLSPD